jgi:hypothetical protein
VPPIKQTIDLAGIPDNPDLGSCLEASEDPPERCNGHMDELTAFQQRDVALRHLCPFREIRLAPLPPTAEFTHDRADLNVVHAAQSDGRRLFPS